MIDKKNRDLVVVGTSAGGVSALKQFVRGLPSDLDATCLIVLHLAPWHKSTLDEILRAHSALPVTAACDFEVFEKGHIYTAVSDRHLTVEGERLRLFRGPRENNHRPAVDALFRSAAVACGPRVIGVVLTGALNCGVAGLLEIKRRGGIAIVQDPEEAEFSFMPESALQYVKVDYCLKLEEMGPIIVRLVGEKPEISSHLPTQDEPGEASAFICPECGGPLFRKQLSDFAFYECRVAHRYSPESLLESRGNEIESALWGALNALCEKAKLSRDLAGRARMFTQPASLEYYEKQAAEAEEHAASIEKLLRKVG